MRPNSLNPLFAESTALKGVGPAIARGLKRLKLERIVDLLFHLPVGAIERLPVEAVEPWMEGRVVTVEVTVAGHDSGGPRSPFRVRALDGAGNTLSLVYFGDGGHYAKRLLPVGERRIVSGRLERYGQALQIVHPDHVVEDAATIPAREPVYALTEGIANKRMGQLAGAAIERAPELPEWIEPSVLATRGWSGWREALLEAHTLEGQGARDRLAYDELLANQLALMLVRADTRQRKGRALPGDGRLTEALVAALPFAPTGAQRRAAAEIAGDMAQATPMLRLLQGDVGSGKTLVAALSMLACVESGAQAAFLAPTELLARQHMATLERMLEGLPVRVAILTGRDKGRARAEVLAGLGRGDIHILVGTHAIFQEAVKYRDLGLVVIDEQHRFGVHQRLMLGAKADRPAHVLVMTATPIPRTLTLTAYGEMDVSRLDELPPGRTPVDTRVVSQARTEAVEDLVARQMESGGQCYWVCPLVEESETVDLASAEERAELLRQRFGARVGLVHGRMKAAEKDAAMADFAAGRTGVLVATTVIEVGVDVPNATLMVIEHAERFGLAQLHQLRGRVGRGAGQSTCILLRAPEMSETARARLALMRDTNDGFVIAEKDLELRGAGEILGTRQSGEVEFRLADPAQMAAMLPIARDDARLLIDRDGGLASARGQAARTLLYLMERDAAVGLLKAG